MSVAGHHLPIWFDEAVGPNDGDVSVWNASTGRFESAPVVDSIPDGTYVDTTTDQTVLGVKTVDSVLTKSLPTVMLRAQGALMDGATNDFAAWTASVTALPSTGGQISVGRGTSIANSDITFNKPNIVVQGESMFTSALKATSAHNTIFQATGAAPNRGNIVIRDLTLDMNGVLPAAVTLFPDDISWTFERVRFKGNTSNGVILNGCSNVTFIDCIFEGNGNPAGTGVNIQQGARRVKFIRCRFRYHKNGILIDTNSVGTTQTEKVVEDVLVDSCTFDSSWWLLRSRFSGSGGTVTYTSTVLTDTGAAFSGIAAPSGTNVRAMPVLATGTSGNANVFYNRLTDATATFITAGVKPGHIFRAGTTFAVVANVESETTVWVEEWLSDTDRSLVGPPYSTAYTIYGVYIGLVTASTATTITVNRWHDLDGFTVTPSAGTRYEVMYGVPNYNLHAEHSSKNVRVVNSVFRRGWSDQISLYGFENLVMGNLVEDGQDFGILVHGQKNRVIGNRVRHQGAQGIAVDGDDSVISSNVCHETPWVNISAITGDLGTSGKRNVFSSNVCRSGGLAHHRYGLILTGVPSTPAQDILVVANTLTGYATNDIYMSATSPGDQTRTKLRSNIYSSISIGANVTSTDQELGSEVLPWLIDIDPFLTAVSHVNWDTKTAGPEIYGYDKRSSGAQNDEINFDVVLAAGTWTIRLMGLVFTDAGVMTVQLDASTVGTVDFYGALAYNQVGAVAGVVVGTTGKKRLKLKMATKNASSSSYVGYLQHITLQRTA